MGEVSTIGLDIAKSVFQVHGVSSDGEVVIRKRVSRAKVLEFFASLPSCLVGIEACPTAHHWSRQLHALGHTVRLMPPSYVKAYLKRSKNDANDAAAICEAVTRPSMRFVPMKSEQQQSGLMLHRSRQLLVRQRTMLSNAIRGHMAELGVISAKGRNGTAELLKIIANETNDCIPAAAQFSLDVLARQYAATTAEIGVIEKRIHAWHRSCEESRRLEEIPGIGPNAPLQEEGAYLIDDAGALADQAFAHPMESLQVVLFGRLSRHKLHRGALDRLSDCLRVAKVVLLSLRVGAHVLGRH